MLLLSLHFHDTTKHSSDDVMLGRWQWRGAGEWSPLAVLRCAVFPLPLVEHLHLLKCFQPMAFTDSTFATPSRNCLHIPRLRNSIIQTLRRLLAMKVASRGCSSVAELLMPCTKFLPPQREAGRQ